MSGERATSAETAVLLGRYFTTSAEFWATLQMNYDLDTARIALGKRVGGIVPLPFPPAEDSVSNEG